MPARDRFACAVLRLELPRGAGAGYYRWSFPLPHPDRPLHPQPVDLIEGDGWPPSTAEFLYAQYDTIPRVVIMPASARTVQYPPGDLRRQPESGLD